MNKENKSTNLDYYIPNIILLIMVIIIDFFMFNKINIEKGKIVDLTNGNLVIAGFLFTAISMVISSLSDERIARLMKYGYLKKYNAAIYISLTFSLSAIIINFAYLYTNTNFINNYIIIIQKFVLVLTINGFAFFIQSIYYIGRILKKISRDIKNKF